MAFESLKPPPNSTLLICPECNLKGCYWCGGKGRIYFEPIILTTVKPKQ